ncbi:hypothetical protein QJQ45_015435 [Haematococcus lacustris]|nr:hypothetical protein QJQ45_015435 [Haematococcus lacustris]
MLVLLHGLLQVYLDVKLEGKALGRIVVQLFPDVTVGSARFRDLSIGKEGVGYRLARFDGIFPVIAGVSWPLTALPLPCSQTYIRCEGATTLSYSATGDSPIAGGASLEALERELEVQSRSHQGPGLVSLVVRDPVERPTQEKLVARNGQLVTMVIEAGGLAANGTTFTITRLPESNLDRTNLIVGQAGGQVLQNSPARGKVLCKASIRVVEGQEVVDAIGALPFARPRDSYFDGPFFAVSAARLILATLRQPPAWLLAALCRPVPLSSSSCWCCGVQAAKAMGDKRATTAEKGFNRPLKRVIVSGGGLIQRPTLHRIIMSMYIAVTLAFMVSMALGRELDEQLIGWRGESYKPQAPQRLPWVETIAWRPRAFYFHNFLTDEEAQHIVNISWPQMQRSTVVGANGSSVLDDYRTSYGTFVNRYQDSIMQAIQDRIALYTHAPVLHQEDMQVLRYGVGQYYHRHQDSLSEDSPRMATLLLYLSDATEGGETAFPERSQAGAMRGKAYANGWAHPQLEQTYGAEFSSCAKASLLVAVLCKLWQHGAFDPP